MAYDNTNTGALFKAKEQKTDKHPGYTGTINVDGREYWLSAWLKASDKAGKYFSLAVKPKDEQPKQADAPTKAQNVPKSFADFKDDPLPF